jgi:hypothetical protein
VDKYKWRLNMGGMPSARGLEWRQRTGDGSHKRYQDNAERLFPLIKCVLCVHEKKNHCTHIYAPVDNVIISVVGQPPEWCPARKDTSGKSQKSD